MNRRRSGSAFTLLEALAALAIIAAASGAVLAARAQSVRAVETAERARAFDRAAADLFDMARHRLLDEPEIDRERGVVTWTGDYLDHPFTVVRSVELVENPAADAVAHAVPRRVPEVVYEITYRGRTAERRWSR